MSKLQLAWDNDDPELPAPPTDGAALKSRLFVYHNRTTDETQPQGFIKENMRNIYNQCVQGNVITITGLLNPPEPNKRYYATFGIRGD